MITIKRRAVGIVLEVVAVLVNRHGRNPCGLRPARSGPFPDLPVR
jgi:hypothetical protein